MAQSICMERQPFDYSTTFGYARGGWYCSLPKGHEGAHGAYVDHDLSGAMKAKWVTT